MYPPPAPKRVRADEVTPSRRQGGEVRALLTPSSVDTRAGFLAELRLEAGETMTEHYHPWSDEHVLVTDGRLLLTVDGTSTTLETGDACLIRRGARHTYRNLSTRPARAAAFLGPLAPDPADGHVDTEPTPQPHAPAPLVGHPGAAGAGPLAGSALDPVDDQGDPMSATTDNTIVIEAPFDTVWQMTNDVASWPTLFTEYSAAEILEHREDSVLFRLTTVPDADGSVWSWVSERFPDRDAATVTAHRVETGPFQFMTIRWDYHESPRGVELRWRQEFTMKPGFRFDDAAMTDRLNRGSREQMAHIKSKVEAAHTAGAPA